MRDPRMLAGAPHMHGREFVAGSVIAALAGTPLAGAADPATAKPEGRRPAIPLRDFGKTGRRLPILAFGGSAIAEQWKANYGPQLPRDRRVAMVRHAFDMGIRYFDTSPNYGESEAILGEALHDVRREVYLATKVGVAADGKGLLDPRDVRASLEGSLRRLRTDHADSVQVHGPAFEYNGLERTKGLYDELVKLRDEKLFRYLGATAHNAFESMYRIIDTGFLDQAMLAYGYFPKGMDTILSHANLQWRERCLDRAQELGIRVVAMKVLGSFVFGHRAAEIVPKMKGEKIAQLRVAALRWALHDSRITLVTVGMIRTEEIDQNVATLSADLTYRDSDRKLLAEFSAEAFHSPIVQQMKVQ